MLFSFVQNNKYDIAKYACAKIYCRKFIKHICSRYKISFTSFKIYLIQIKLDKKILLTMTNCC